MLIQLSIEDFKNIHDEILIVFVKCMQHKSNFIQSGLV